MPAVREADNASASYGFVFLELEEAVEVTHLLPFGEWRYVSHQVIAKDGSSRLRGDSHWLNCVSVLVSAVPARGHVLVGYSLRYGHPVLALMQVTVRPSIGIGVKRPALGAEPH